MSKQKIALLIPSLEIGGAERVCVTLADAFSRRGFAVSFVTLNATGGLRDEVQASHQIVDLNAHRMRQAFGPLLQYLRTERPDAMIANMWPLSSLGVVAARCARIPVLAVEHGVQSVQYRDNGLVHRGALRASLALSMRLAPSAGVSRGVARDLDRLGMRRNRTTTLYNPIPAFDCASDEDLAKAEALWGDAEHRILTVGSLKPVKNHELLLRAFARIGNAKARLIILGDGKEREKLEGLAAKLGITSRVVFAGNQKPAAFYQTAGLFVLSSDREGFGNVLVEAMGAGLPIISTDCPFGPREVLGNDQYGRLVPPGDEEALRHALSDPQSYICDPERQIARAGEFAPDIVADRYLAELGLKL